MSPKNTAGIWYHGSNKKFSLLREGSTITPNRALAEAFSHKPPILSCEADGTLLHNGKKYGYLYCNRRTDRRGARSVPASAHNTWSQARSS